MRHGIAVLLASVGIALGASAGASCQFVSKAEYLDLIEAAISAYSDDHIARYIETVERDGVEEHGFPRLAANIGYLLAHGRLLEKRDVFRKMMTISCREAAKGLMRKEGNEFSVKELTATLVVVEKARLFDKSVTDAWRADLAKVEARRCYSSLSQVVEAPQVRAEQAYNWCVFACASEQARIAAGIGGDAALIEKCVSDQLRWFDANGMYRDPNQPAVYDSVTRLQFMILLHFGYDGPSRAGLEALLDRAAEPTLAMLSAAGEIPYGGRSNQFLHNNTFYAADCEWYAARYHALGDVKKAARFRRAARDSVDALQKWLSIRPIRHVKNLYPRGSGERGSGIGCEGYAYFNKYMVTMGSWAMLCHAFADESVPPCQDADATEAPLSFATTPDFHFVFLKAGDYSAQFDYNADSHYDCDGLGRLHRRGAPAAICMSTPCAKNPNYSTEFTNTCSLAVVPSGCDTIIPAGRGSENGFAWADWTAGALSWKCRLTPKGLDMSLCGSGDVALKLPAFEFDGERRTEISCDGKSLSIRYCGWICTYTSDGEIVDRNRVCCNRNGRYRMFEAHGMGKVRVKIDIQKVCTLSAMAGHTLVVAGDSLTADSNFTNGNPKASWARALEKYMKSGCTIDNHAKGGASTKSFIVSGRWAETVKAVKPGDYVLIQFGGNDQKWHTPFYLEKRFADHKTTFRDNIRKFVKEVREKGGKPVLVSESVRATFDENGKLFDKVDKKGISLACYATAMREMSEELKTEFVDMNRLTHDLLAKLGKEGAHKLYVISTGWIDPKTGKPSTDTNHTIKAGAEAYAKLFYEDVKKRNLDIAELFN